MPSPPLPEHTSDPRSSVDIIDCMEAGGCRQGRPAAPHGSAWRKRMLQDRADSCTVFVREGQLSEALPTGVSGSLAAGGATPSALEAPVGDRDARLPGGGDPARTPSTSTGNATGTARSTSAGRVGVGEGTGLGDFDLRGLEGVRDPNRRLLGARFVPIDLVMEQVRSLGVQSLLILTIIFTATSRLILRDRSELHCQVPVVSFERCRGKLVDLAQPLGGIFDDRSLSTLVLVFLGLLNSRYFLKGCGAIGVWTARVLGVLLTLMLVWLASVDLARCDARATSAADLCSAFDGPVSVTRFLFDSFGASLEDEAQISVFWGQSVGLFCEDRAMTNATIAACTRAVGADWCDAQTLTCACQQVMGCFDAFERRVPTTVHSGTYAALLWLLLAAELWDMLGARLLPDWVTQWAHAGRGLCRRVPLTLFSAVILDFNWCVTRASRLGPSFWNKTLNSLSQSFGLSKEPWLSIVLWSVPLFLLVQLLICVVAAVYNVRTYLHHTRLMAGLPWAMFRQREEAPPEVDGADASPPAGEREGEALLREAGLDIERLRDSPNMWAPYYFGSVWASFLLGCTVLAVFPTVVVLAVAILALVPEARPLLWRAFFGPIYSSFGVYAVLTLTIATAQSVLWGKKNSFPRRPALLAMWDAGTSVALLYASPALAAARLLKSALMSTVGLLVVTRPGTHEGILEDTCHTFYLSILRVERFRLEVKKWGARNPKLGAASCCADFCRIFALMGLVWWLALAMYCLLAWPCGVPLTESLPAGFLSMQLIPLAPETTQNV